jgi:hypothetical protein
MEKSIFLSVCYFDFLQPGMAEYILHHWLYLSPREALSCLSRSTSRICQEMVEMCQDFVKGVEVKKNEMHDHATRCESGRTGLVQASSGFPRSSLFGSATQFGRDWLIQVLLEQ